MQTQTPIELAHSFNGFDWFLVILLVLSTLLAFFKGIIRAIFSIGGLICGIIAAAWNYKTLAHAMSKVIPSFQLAEVIAFVVILAVVMLVFSLIAKLLRTSVSAVGLGIFDKLLGAVFGFFRGCLLGVAAMMILLAFVPDSAWVKDSQLAPYFLDGAHAVSFIVPGDFRRQIADGTRHLIRDHDDFLKAHTLEQHR